jgi:hypothetical protein
VWDGERYVMVRNMLSTLNKDTISIVPLRTPKEYRAWLKSIADCGISLTGGIPVMQEFYMMFDRSSLGEKARKESDTLKTGMQMLAKGMDRKYRNPTEESRYSFWKAFGVTPERQIAVESYYASVTLLDYESVNPPPHHNVHVW